MTRLWRRIRPEGKETNSFTTAITRARNKVLSEWPQKGRESIGVLIRMRKHEQQDWVSH